MANEKNQRPKVGGNNNPNNSGKNDKKGNLPRFSMSWIYVLIAV